MSAKYPLFFLLFSPFSPSHARQWLPPTADGGSRFVRERDDDGALLFSLSPPPLVSLSLSLSGAPRSRASGEREAAATGGSARSSSCVCETMAMGMRSDGGALPRRPLYHPVSHLTGAAAPFMLSPLIHSSLLSSREQAASGRPSRRRKSALEAGGNERETAATLAVMPPCRRALFPDFSPRVRGGRRRW